VGKENPHESVSLARSLAMLTYRTSGEMDERFTGETANPDDPDSFPIWSYLQYKGEQYTKIMNPERFLSLSRSIDHHFIEPSKIKTPMTVIACNQDILVPLSYCQDLVDHAHSDAKLICFDSKYGHDSFLKEESHISQALLKILKINQGL
jgi:homoserine O-acetyltransferase